MSLRSVYSKLNLEEFNEEARSEMSSLIPSHLNCYRGIEGTMHVFKTAFLKKKKKKVADAPSTEIFNLGFFFLLPSKSPVIIKTPI